MAEAIVSFGVEKLWNLISREYKQLQGLDDHLITQLKIDLNLLRSFLKDADAKKHTNAVVRNCVEEIKELVYDAEDIIETFLLEEQLSKTKGIILRIKNLACIAVDRREVALDMRCISKRISKVISNMQSFGVQQIIIDNGYTQQPIHQKEMRQTFSSNLESADLVGLEQNVEKLISYLVIEDDIQVVSITGMGGIGKTTLARQVFNHEMIKHHFDGVVWVCVSQQFTRKYVWQMMLWKLSPRYDEHRDSEITEDELQDKLVRLLETQKSLIVLDDVWKQEDWDRIKLVFPPNKGWKVVLTSRKEDIALPLNPAYVTLKPECLTPEESWILFQRIAFPRKDASESKANEEMEEMGKQMVKFCGGLPLAIKVLGGLLAAQQTLREWTRVFENIRSHIFKRTSSSNEDMSSVYYVLSLSFEELPIYLKHCFLHLSHFPEDHVIDVDKFSYLVAAEGISNPSYYNGATIRDVVEGYVEELMKRNMVFAERDVITSRFQTCRLHDMMREVCLLKAKEENFLQIFSKVNCSEHSYKPRRLVVHWSDSFHEEAEINNRKLRSLLLIWESSEQGWKLSGLCLEKLLLLRVLDLSRAKFHGEKLPSNIGNLIHLRYLSLYKARFLHLPSSLQNLKLLLYLNLHVFSKAPIYMPNVFKEMRELRFLSLPGRMHEKTKLELRNLVNLETLEYFTTEHSSLTDLHGMSKLQTLKIYVKGCNMESLSSSLSKLRYLKELTLYDSRDYQLMDDTKGFVLECVNLNQLVLSVYMPKLPDEQHFPLHLTSITLSDCCLEEDPMPVLEKLVYLNEVSLGSGAFAGKRMVCSANGFPKLHRFVLTKQPELEEWRVEEGSMLQLRFLFISECEKLREVPDGLRFIGCLKEVKIEMMKREFKEKLEETGQDYYKVRHIPCLVFILCE